MSEQYIDIGEGKAVKEEYFKSLWSCQRCGRCCNKNGFLVTGDEIAKLANIMGISKSEFKRSYISNKKIEGKWYFSCKQPCIFFDSGGCTIYDDRPMVCRLFPFVGKVIDEFCPAVHELKEGLLRGIGDIEKGQLKT